MIIIIVTAVETSNLTQVDRSLKEFPANERILVGGGGEGIDPTYFLLFSASDAVRRLTDVIISGLQEQ
jgi:hypothetical protein